MNKTSKKTMQIHEMLIDRLAESLNQLVGNVINHDPEFIPESVLDDIIVILWMHDNPRHTERPSGKEALEIILKSRLLGLKLKSMQRRELKQSLVT